MKSLTMTTLSLTFIKKDLSKWIPALFIWGKVLKNGPSNIFGRQPLKNLK